jgi:hypothetical protein
MGKGNEFGIGKYFCSYFPSNFLHAVKTYNMGLWLYFPLKEGVLQTFITLRNESPWPGLNP